MSARGPDDPFDGAWGMLALVVIGVVATLFLMWALDGAPS